MCDRASYLLQQDKIRIVLTSPLGPDGFIADHVRRHDDGVRDLAFAQLRSVWPHVRLVVRDDTGFCRDAPLTWCEMHAMDCVVGLARHARLPAPITDELAALREHYATTHAPAISWRRTLLRETTSSIRLRFAEPPHNRNRA